MFWFYFEANLFEASMLTIPCHISIWKEYSYHANMASKVKVAASASTRICRIGFKINANMSTHPH